MCSNPPSSQGKTSTMALIWSILEILYNILFLQTHRRYGITFFCFYVFHWDPVSAWNTSFYSLKEASNLIMLEHCRHGLHGSILWDVSERQQGPVNNCVCPIQSMTDFKNYYANYRKECISSYNSNHMNYQWRQIVRYIYIYLPAHMHTHTHNTYHTIKTNCGRKISVFLGRHAQTWHFTPQEEIMAVSTYIISSTAIYAHTYKKATWP